MTADRPDYEDHDRVEGGRPAPYHPYAKVADWVLLADIHATAKTLYALLCAHVNVKRSDGEVWPKRAHLATMLGLKRENSVTANLKVLAGIGALDIRQERYCNGMRMRNVYTVHAAPPPGYDGLVSLVDYYAAVNDETPGHTAGRSTARPERNDETPGRTAGRSTARPAARSTARPAARSTARELDEGFELDEVELDEQNLHLPAAKSQPGAASPAVTSEEEESDPPTTGPAAPGSGNLTPGLAEARAFLKHLPRKGRRNGSKDRAELLDRLAAFAAAGCDMGALRRAYLGNAVGVDNIEVTLLWRLRDGQLLPEDFVPAALPVPRGPARQLAASPELIPMDSDPESIGASIAKLKPKLAKTFARNVPGLTEGTR